MPLIIEFLDDRDVLERLVITGKAIRPSLVDYQYRYWQHSPSEARELTGWHRYLPVQPAHIFDWRGENLRFCTAVKHLTMHEDFDRPLIHGDLPLSLQLIDFGVSFNHPLPINTLPPHLKEINLGNSYNQPLQIGALPSSLECLHFGYLFDRQLLPGMIPHGVSHIQFGEEWRRSVFNQPLVPGAFPNSLKKLSLSAAFDQELLPRCLPSSLTSLTFDEKFNQPLERDVLPNSITELFLSDQFNQPLFRSTLPSKLKCLVLGDGFNQPLSEGVLPRDLEYLVIGESFTNSVWLPETLKKLKISSSITAITFLNPFPLSLYRLELCTETDQTLPAARLPESLTKLIIAQPFQVGSIPDGVTDFTYHCDHAIPFNAIPSSVTFLTFGDQFNQPITAGVIPSSVTHLVFGATFNQLLLPDDIPNSVTHIKFGKDFNQVLIPRALPESITHIGMDHENGVFDQPLVVVNVPVSPTASFKFGSIPRFVTHLILSRDYNKPLRTSALPDTVTHLVFGKKFIQSLPNDVLPHSLHHLQLPEDSLIDTSHVKATVIRSSVEKDLGF